ncbi:unnamed protein product [Rhizophagus irregularis]|nr:unnamed protein product [Rhizophagus irregularis]CAB5390971.1 unnamed protein product [Rhizophagus irregularis]
MWRPTRRKRASRQPMLDKRFPVDLNATVAFKPELLFGECEFKLRNIFTVLSSYMTALIRRLFLTLYQSEFMVRGRDYDGLIKGVL